MKYPPARCCDHVDHYHGLPVEDPYRWLEDPDSAETREWVDSQTQLTSEFLSAIPEREFIRQRLTDLWNYERFGMPFKEGGRYFFSRNDGLQNQAVLYTTDRLDGAATVLMDPNTLSNDGTVALSGLQVSPDGNLLAYGIAHAGSDWQEWYVRDVRTGQDLDEHLRWIKFSGASWTQDNLGFFYSRFDEPVAGRELQDTNYFQKLYYHRLGTSQSEDALVYERPDHKEWGFAGVVTDDGRYLIITVWVGTENRNGVFYRELSAGSPVVELLPDFDARYEFVGNDGHRFWFSTDESAPRGRLIEIDVHSPGRSGWREILPQTPDTLYAVSFVGGHFLASYLQDAHAAVRVIDQGGKTVRNVELPGLGSVAGLGGHPCDPETFFQFTGFTDPGTIYRYDVATGERSVFRTRQLRFDPSEYECRQVFFHSSDGTRVPMFISHKKGVSGPRKTVLYGYGGFNISVTPFFNVQNLAWMEMGGIFAVANIRGGSEYGEDWHQAGIKDRKQNGFNDFIGAAEWLISNGLTQPSLLAIMGASNGGLLVGASILQRPELFGAAVPQVGVMDMLRFHKFTIGWAWVSDYGSPDDPADFKILRSYSPCHNATPQAFPATMIVTADHDDRVVPAHSFKFTAVLQAAQRGSAPILARIETRVGHGAGRPTGKAIDEAADMLSFLTEVLRP